MSSEDHARLPIAVHVFAGGVGGTLSAVVTSPLEVVKTRLQASGGSAFRASAMRSAANAATTASASAGAGASASASASAIAGGVGGAGAMSGASSAIVRHVATAAMIRSVWRNEGLPGLFRGFVPTVLGVGPSRALYFGVYNATKRRLHAAGLGDTTATHAGAAATAGFVSYTASSPIWVVKTRLQVQSHGSAAARGGEPHYKGSLDAVRVIYAREGFRGFFQGISASYLGISEGVIQFVLYERFKAFLLNSERKAAAAASRAASQVSTSTHPTTPQGSLSSSSSSHDTTGRAVAPDSEIGPVGFALRMAAASGLAKVVASTLTYPHEVLRTRLREQTRPIGAPVSSLRYRGLRHAVRVILAEEGVLAFYAGLSTHLIRVAPSSAVLFASYEAVSQLYMHFWGDTVQGEGSAPPPANIK